MIMLFKKPFCKHLSPTKTQKLAYPIIIILCLIRPTLTLIFLLLRETKLAIWSVTQLVLLLTRFIICYVYINPYFNLIKSWILIKLNQHTLPPSHDKVLNTKILFAVIHYWGVRALILIIVYKMGSRPFSYYENLKFLILALSLILTLIYFNRINCFITKMLFLVFKRKIYIYIEITFVFIFLFIAFILQTRIYLIYDRDLLYRRPTERAPPVNPERRRPPPKNPNPHKFHIIRGSIISGRYVRDSHLDPISEPNNTNLTTSVSSPELTTGGERTFSETTRLDLLSNHLNGSPMTYPQYLGVLNHPYSPVLVINAAEHLEYNRDPRLFFANFYRTPEVDYNNNPNRRPNIFRRPNIPLNSPPAYQEARPILLPPYTKEAVYLPPPYSNVREPVLPRYNEIRHSINSTHLVHSDTTHETPRVRPFVKFLSFIRCLLPCCKQND